MDEITKKRLERLERCYNIVGDGKAVARMDELLKDPDFRESVKRLTEADLLRRENNG